MDISFLVFNFIFIAFLIGETFYIRILFYLEIKINYITNIYLSSINGIQISSIKLPQNFDSKEKKEKKQIILNYLSDMKSIQKPNKKEIASLINQKREKLGLESLVLTYKIVNFMTILPSEAIFFEYRNIFTIDKNKYLIWLSFEEFIEKFNKNDNDLMNIIEKLDLNSICIISRREDPKLCIYIWNEGHDNLIDTKILQKLH